MSRLRRSRSSSASALLLGCAIVSIAPGACFDFGGYSLLIVEPDLDGGDQDVSEPACVEPWTGPCTTLPQCGCGTGQACDVVDLAGTTSCVLDKGLAAGVACGELFAGCGAGLTCVNGACKKFCRSTRGCAADGLCFQVMYQADGGGIGVPGLKVCTDQCDYMKPEASCGPGTACYPHGDADSGYSECMAAGNSYAGCAINEDCAAGLACGEDKRCHPWCRRDTVADCPPPQRCIAIKVGQQPVFYYLGDEAYGVCK